MSTETSSLPIGASWPGAGDHKGHTITKIEEWPVRIENCTVYFKKSENVVIPDDIERIGGGKITSCRVRCSCSVEWETAGRPVGIDITMPEVVAGS